MVMSNDRVVINKKRLDLLVSIPFVASLTILIFNDYYLKYQYPNWLTGKLSDFAGIFVFSVFFTSIFPRYFKQILLLTALFFCYWKSPLSETFIYFWNHSIPFNIQRTIDHSDLLALLMLPLTAFYVRRPISVKTERPALQYVLLLISFIAIMGTSRPIEIPDSLVKTRKEEVNKYYYKAEHLRNNVKRRLEKLIFTLPDTEVLELKGVRTGVWENDKFTAITYYFNRFRVNTWVFTGQPDHLTEYYVLPENSCDHELAFEGPEAVTEAFLSSRIDFFRTSYGVNVQAMVLRFCDVPEKKNRKEALDYFQEKYLTKIEQAFY